MVKGNGALFQNKNRASDKHPEYTGSFELTKELVDAICHAFDHGQTKMQLAGWKKQSERAGTYLSLSISPPYEKPQERPQATRPQTQSRRDDGADIPF
jgi:uncharacterized protein (DUF736 family)